MQLLAFNATEAMPRRKTKTPLIAALLKIPVISKR
jgi:hypothetical protein